MQYYLFLIEVYLCNIFQVITWYMNTPTPTLTQILTPTLTSTPTLTPTLSDTDTYTFRHSNIYSTHRHFFNLYLFIMKFVNKISESQFCESKIYSKIVFSLKIN